MLVLHVYVLCCNVVVIICSQFNFVEEMAGEDLGSIHARSLHYTTPYIFCIRRHCFAFDCLPFVLDIIYLFMAYICILFIDFSDVGEDKFEFQS